MPRILPSRIAATVAFEKPRFDFIEAGKLNLTKPPMIHHQATILNDFDSGMSKLLGHGVMTDSLLLPDRLWCLREDVVNVRRNVLRTTKDIHHVELARHNQQLPKEFFTENPGDVAIVDRD